MTLNAENIVREIQQQHFPVGQYIVVGGSVLAMRGIRTTHDIDIVATQELLAILRQSDEWTIIDRPNGEPGFAKGCMEVYPDVNCVAYHPETVDLIARAEMIKEIPCSPLKDVYLFKKGYGREKDARDMKLIESYLASQK